MAENDADLIRGDDDLDLSGQILIYSRYFRAKKRSKYFREVE